MGVGRASNHAEFFPLPLAPSRLGEGGKKKTYPCKLPPGEGFSGAEGPQGLLLIPAILCGMQSRHQPSKYLTTGLMCVERGDDLPLIHHR